jgi:hypothetical protein
MLQDVPTVVERRLQRDPRSEQSVLDRDHDRGQSRGEIAVRPIRLDCRALEAAPVHVQDKGQNWPHFYEWPVLPDPDPAVWQSDVVPAN